MTTPTPNAVELLREALKAVLAEGVSQAQYQIICTALAQPAPIAGDVEAQAIERCAKIVDRMAVIGRQSPFWDAGQAQMIEDLASQIRELTPDSGAIAEGPFRIYSEPDVGLPPSLFEGTPGQEGFTPVNFDDPRMLHRICELLNKAIPNPTIAEAVAGEREEPQGRYTCRSCSAPTDNDSDVCDDCEEDAIRAKDGGEA